MRISELPPYVPNAVIAIEDRRFRSHFGVDPVGLMRAVTKNLYAGGVVEGGSTLTQQLAKNMFLTPERSLKRKVQEVVLSLWLETEYTKDQILEMYLNRVYFGSGAYGIDAAANTYFKTDPREPDARPGGDARRRSSRPEPLLAEPQSGCSAPAADAGAGGDDRCRLHHRRRGEERARQSAGRRSTTRRAAAATTSPTG